MKKSRACLRSLVLWFGQEGRRVFCLVAKNLFLLSAQVPKHVKQMVSKPNFGKTSALQMGAGGGVSRATWRVTEAATHLGPPHHACPDDFCLAESMRP